MFPRINMNTINMMFMEKKKEIPRKLILLHTINRWVL
jgi:hypothetical protein